VIPAGFPIRDRARPESYDSPRLHQRSDLVHPLLPDPLDPEQVISRSIRSTLDDPPGDHRSDPRKRFQLFLTRRVDVDKVIRVLGTVPTSAPCLGDLLIPDRRPPDKLRVSRYLPPLPSADDRDRAVLVGSKERDSPSFEESKSLRMRVSVFVPLPETDNGQAGSNDLQPTSIGPVATPMMRELQDRAVPDQFRDVRLPERPLPGLAVSRE
jgi:hypothetical protein